MNNNFKFLPCKKVINIHNLFSHSVLSDMIVTLIIYFIILPYTFLYNLYNKYFIRNTFCSLTRGAHVAALSIFFVLFLPTACRMCGGPLMTETENHQRKTQKTHSDWCAVFPSEGFIWFVCWRQSRMQKLDSGSERPFLTFGQCSYPLLFPPLFSAPRCRQMQQSIYVTERHWLSDLSPECGLPLLQRDRRLFTILEVRIKMVSLGLWSGLKHWLQDLAPQDQHLHPWVALPSLLCCWALSIFLFFF